MAVVNATISGSLLPSHRRSVRWGVGVVLGAGSFLGCTSEAAFTSLQMDGSEPAAVDSSVDSSGGVGGGGGAGASSVSPIGPSGTFELTFREECNAPLDPEVWITYMVVGDRETGGFREWNERAEWMADEQVEVIDGLCRITAEEKQIAGHDYVSGTLNTAGAFSQLYGFFEARLRVPVGRGLWPVWWLRSIDGWPPAIELMGREGPADETGDVGHVWTEDGETRRQDTVLPQRDWERFHVMGAEWTESEIVYYLDGQEVARHTTGVSFITEPLYPIFNLSIGTGEAVPPPDDTTAFPARLEFDWVRIYQRKE